MKDGKREPLKSGDVLELVLQDSRGQSYVQTAVVEALIGEGASCLTYVVQLNRDGKISSRMIMKEFYPDTKETQGRICRVGAKLEIPEEVQRQPEFAKSRERFLESFAVQNALADGAAMEVMVKPYLCGVCGDSLYLLSDMHLGEVLGNSRIVSLSDQLWVIYRTAEAIQLLHDQGYLYMDLNPKNVLWIRSQQAVKLFDVDSIVSYRRLEEVHGIRVTYPYVAPELEELEEWFEVNKSAFLRPSWDIYCLGLLFFELLFDRFPTEKDLETGYGPEGELQEICRRNGCDDPEVCRKMEQILHRMLHRSFRVRYRRAEEICKELNTLKQRLDAGKFIPKKEYAKANYTMQAYHILDQWPVYQWAGEEDGRRSLDLALIGSHPMREAFVKAAFATVQMPDSVLRIRLYAGDVTEFLEKLQAENPALLQVIRVYINDICIKEEIDRSLCSEPMAEFYLYEREPSALTEQDLRNMKSRYLLLLMENREELTGIAGRIAEAASKREEDGQRTLWMGYADSEADQILERESGSYRGIQLVPISVRQNSSYYDETLISTQIMKRARNVHGMYLKGKQERISWEQIQKDFESSVDNMESSMRSALSVQYKIGSVGLDAASETLAEDFYQAVLQPETRGVFEQMVALEHLSWCAYRIIHGWSLPTEEQIRAYAFNGRNDFKEVTEKLHPCLCTCMPGSSLAHLERKDWEYGKLDKNQSGKLDDLDRMSLLLHQIAGEKSETEKKEINRLFGRLDDLVLTCPGEGVQEALRWLEIIKDRVYTGESNAEILWEQAFSDLQKSCQEQEISDQVILECIEEIRRRIRVLHEYNACHDYKKSDEDIIRGIPFILSTKKTERIIKPHVRNARYRWQNVLSTLYLEPEELILVPMEGEKVNADFYRKFLELRGLQTKLRVVSLEEIEESKQLTVIDVTGLDGLELHRISRNKILTGLDQVLLRDRKLVGITSHFVEMYARPIHLTVEETLYLFGASMHASPKESAILSLGSRYGSIWKSYTQMHAWRWKVLVGELSKIEKQNRREFAGGPGGEMEKYVTEPVTGQALLSTDIDNILESCRQRGLIAEYTMPEAEDELPVTFSTDSRDTAQVLQKIIQIAQDEPLRHHFFFEVEERDARHKELEKARFFVRDKTDYVSARIRDEILTKPNGVCESLAEVLETGLRMLERNGTQGENQKNVLQNLRIRREGNELVFSFKYATKGVRECLQREGNILEAMIYFTCLAKGIFDDVKINSRFCWNRKENAVMDEHTVNNEIDIIGTKNLRTYFISAKMAYPETAHLLEIKYFADYFGIEGKPILVTSHYQTKDEQTARPVILEERSRQMGVAYMNRTVIDERQLGNLLRWLVEEDNGEI